MADDAKKDLKSQLSFADDDTLTADTNKANVPGLQEPEPGTGDIPVVRAEDTAASRNAPPTGGIIENDAEGQKNRENAEAEQPEVKSGPLRKADADRS